MPDGAVGDQTHGPYATTERGTGRLRRGVHAAARLAALISALCVVALMLTTTADVLRRTATGRALPGSVEYGELLMVGMVFLGLAYAQHQKEHVSVSVLTSRLPVRSAMVVRTTGMLTMVGFLLWLSVAAYGEAMRSLASGEYRFGLLQVPMWPARLVIPVGVALLALETLIDLWDAVRTPRTAGRSDPSSGPKRDGGPG